MTKLGFIFFQNALLEKEVAIEISIEGEQLRTEIRTKFDPKLVRYFSNLPSGYITYVFGQREQVIDSYQCCLLWRAIRQSLKEIGFTFVLGINGSGMLTNSTPE
jgi:hypothetical protein